MASETEYNNFQIHHHENLKSETYTSLFICLLVVCLFVSIYFFVIP